MPQVARSLLPLFFLLGVALPAAAQGRQPPEDEPIVAPVKHATDKDRDHREGLNQYVLGLLCEREDRLVEALRAWENSAKLDADAPAVFRGLVALYVALERPSDAMTATETVLRLDPQDYRTWFFFARQLRVQEKLKDAAAALQSGLDCPAVKEHPSWASKCTTTWACSTNAQEPSPNRWLRLARQQSVWKAWKPSPTWRA